MVSKVMQELRKLNAGATIYNDKLKDGTRSIKVGGWIHGQYLAAKRHLEAAGFTVTLRTVAVNPNTTYNGKRGRKQTRLHVSE